MDIMARQALSYYDIVAKTAENLHLHGTFKITDDENQNFFLKIYGIDDDSDIVPGERVYHTYEQIQLESEILLLLSGSALKTAAPIKNRDGDFVTTLGPDSDGEPMFATITSFIDGVAKKHTEAPTLEEAYIAGAAAARLHLESKVRLLPLAAKRPHKRQGYMRKIQKRLSRGIEIGTLTEAQYEMSVECCEAVIECMDRLDLDMENNVGLVHTDIQNSNIIYGQNQVTLVDFSRSVYSYYLYDLAEMCLHSDFGGSSPELQKAILRGYHSVKPLDEYGFFAMQTFFAVFILTLMALCIESEKNAWLDHVLKWFTDEVHPGLVSGKGYLDPSLFEDIL